MLAVSRSYASAVAAEPFLNGSSSIYVEEMFNSWQQDPQSVHKSWDVFFRNTGKGALPGEAYVAPPGIASSPGPTAAVATG